MVTESAGKTQLSEYLEESCSNLKLIEKYCTEKNCFRNMKLDEKARIVYEALAKKLKNILAIINFLHDGNSGSVYGYLYSIAADISGLLQDDVAGIISGYYTFLTLAVTTQLSKKSIISLPVESSCPVISDPQKIVEYLDNGKNTFGEYLKSKLNTNSIFEAIGKNIFDPKHNEDVLERYEELTALKKLFDEAQSRFQDLEEIS